MGWVFAVALGFLREHLDEYLDGLGEQAVKRAEERRKERKAAVMGQTKIRGFAQLVVQFATERWEGKSMSTAWTIPVFTRSSSQTRSIPKPGNVREFQVLPCA